MTKTSSYHRRVPRPLCRFGEALCDTHHIVAVAKNHRPLEGWMTASQSAVAAVRRWAPMRHHQSDAMANPVPWHLRVGAASIYGFTLAVHAAPLGPPTDHIDAKGHGENLSRCNVTATSTLITYGGTPLLGRNRVRLCSLRRSRRGGTKVFGSLWGHQGRTDRAGQKLAGRSVKNRAARGTS